MRAEWHYRHQSLLDPLTGLLNRLALQRRFEELRTQAAMSGDEICVLIGDIDHFKLINDAARPRLRRRGAGRGRRALRTNLRSFSLLYRLGGEEFLALLPGLDVPQGTRSPSACARRLRSRPRGIDVTISFGVASRVAAPSPSTGCSGKPTRGCTRPSGQGETASRRLPDA